MPQPLGVDKQGEEVESIVSQDRATDTFAQMGCCLEREVCAGKQCTFEPFEEPRHGFMELGLRFGAPVSTGHYCMVLEQHAQLSF